MTALGGQSAQILRPIRSACNVIAVLHGPSGDVGFPARFIPIPNHREARPPACGVAVSFSPKGDTAVIPQVRP